MSQTQNRINKLVTLAMLAAVAYVVMFVGRIPIVLFLKYDPKDMVIAISGFLYGPLAAAAISAVVSLVEMFSTNDTGIIGFTMNVLSTCAFVCPAAWLYRRKRTIRRAVEGLILGAVLMTAVMVLWNYLITPLYMHQPREAVASLLLPVFVPFNLLKAGLNTALTLLLYQPVSTALRRSGLLPSTSHSQAPENRRRLSMGVTITALVLLATCVLLVLVFMEII